MTAGLGARGPLFELAALFLRLGFTAFGGPTAHVAIMQNEIVVRRRWLSPERFLDLLGAANLLPGPSSTELAIFIGYERGGWPGLVLAGLCFILPSAGIVTALAWAYVRFGSLTQTVGMLYGTKPVVVAIAIQALWGLAPKAIKKSYWLGALCAMACLAGALGVDAVVVLLGAGIASAAEQRLGRSSGAASVVLFGGLAGSGATVTVTLPAIFVSFLKVGAMVFGSGYVLLAFLRADLVDRMHWLTERQLLDAVAIGQATPGPVFTTATFIGYVLGGGWGALLATVGIFLPGFLLVAMARPLVARARRSRLAASFLDGVNVAALALLIVVTVELGRAAIVDRTTSAIAAAGAILLIRFHVSTTWLVVGGALTGMVAHYTG